MTEHVARDQERTLDTLKTTAAVGFVKGRDQFRRAILGLQSAGFRRADIDLMASDEVVESDLHGIYQRPESLRRISPKEAFVTDDDETALRALTVGTLSSLGALGAVSMVVASGGALALAIGAAVLSGALAGGMGALIARKVTEAFEADLRHYLENGAIAVFVRVRNDREEHLARDVLTSAGAERVQVQALEIEKRLEHVPLADLVPDPWLGSERLGQVGPKESSSAE